jgi:glycosyltransferase involved in cell wall biosynthesis
MGEPMSRGQRIVVNRSFATQRVTGQQRYAGEIADRLVGRPSVGALEPMGWWRGSPLRVWVWALSVLPVRAGSRVLLSLTARAPLWARRHVLVVHDLFVLTNPEWFSRKYVLTHAPLLRFQLRTAKALVAVSEPVADQLAGYGVPVCVAPNAPSAVFSASSTQDDEEVLEARGLRRGTYLLAVGSLDPRKNLPLLARAYAALTPQERAAHPLVVVGGGAAIFRSQDLAWSPEVIDAGYVTDDELRALYAGARAVVFVSLAEGFGLPLVEAAAAGAGSLVISDIEVFRWVCGDGAYYVDPTSAESITAGLRSSIDAELRPGIDLGRFVWDESARRVGELCDSVFSSEVLLEGRGSAISRKQPLDGASEEETGA